jgi:hypothetical protein
MNDNDKVGGKSTSEFDKLLNQLDTALSKQDELICDIKKKVNTIIEPNKSTASDCEKETNLGGFVGEVQTRIATILILNGELEEINETLRRIIG